MTRCKNGHPRTPENTRKCPDGKVRCRVCDAARVRERYHRADAYKRIRRAALEALALIERGRSVTAAAMLREAVGDDHRITRAMRG